MNVFYSWQSDCRAATNRRFIREVLDCAAERLNEVQSLEEAERNDEQIKIDQDTQGILGSPNITDAIFEKVRECDVFVADTTLTGQTANGKKALNSNVAIELGYALGVRGFECLLLFMNTAFGSPEELPFDLQGRRFPRVYDLPDGASAEQIAAEKTRLIEELVPILKMYRDKLVDQGVVAGESYFPIPATTSPGKFWTAGEGFIPVYESLRKTAGKTHMSFDVESMSYARVFPRVQMPEISPARCVEIAAAHLRPLRDVGGSTDMRNRYGAIVYAHEEFEVYSAAQVFRNRELWAFDNYVMSRVEARYEELGDRFVPSSAVLKDCALGIANLVKTASVLDYAFQR